MTEQDEEFTIGKWAVTKPEVFAITDEQYQELMALAAPLYDKLVEYNVPASFNFVRSQEATGQSATEGFTTHGDTIARTTMEIIFGSIIAQHSAAGLANMMNDMAYYAQQKCRIIESYSDLVLLPGSPRI